MKSRDILLHVAGWLVFFVTPILLSPPGELEATFRDTSNMESLALRNLLLMGFFYLNYLYLAPRILHTHGMGRFLLVLIPIVILVSLVNWQIHHALSEPMMRPFDGPPDGFRPGPGPGPGPGFGRPRPMMLASSLFPSLLITIIISSISTSLVLWENVTRGKIEEQERALQRVASELAILKLQISPHFLFNTLNNIRWLVRSKSDNAEEAVMKLSKLLRYVLYQTNEDRVPLEREVDNLRDYVELQQLRLTDGGHFHLLVDGDPGKSTIVPLLLLPLAENFFKYGDFTEPSVNRFEVTITDHRLHVRTVNRIAAKQPETTKEESGIGLSNISRRLALHYPDKHEFTTAERDGIFEVNLGIILT